MQFVLKEGAFKMTETDIYRGIVGTNSWGSKAYGREEIRSLCEKAGLRLERFEKRGFFQLHCVARKP